MNQEQTPRFVHISVGSSEPSAEEQSEAEEIISIGAVASEPTSASASVSEPALAASPAVLSEPDTVLLKTSGPKESARTVQPEQEDDDLGAPMSLTQKIVLIVCLIGLIVAGVFIVDYWLAL